MRSRIVFATIMVLLLGLVLVKEPGKSWAKSTTLSASVEIFKPLVLTKGALLDFGIINPPSPGFTQTFQVWPGKDSTVVGPGNGFFVSGEHIGTFDVSGSVGRNFRMFAALGTCDKPGIGWNFVTVTPSSGTLDATASVHGAIFIDGDVVTAGEGSCSYTVTANYS